MPIPIPLRPSTDKSLLIGTSEEATSSWVTALLQAPATVTNVSAIGTGQLSKTIRVRFTLEGSNEEESLVVKIASESPDSQAVGMEYGVYETETIFYQQLGEMASKTGAVPYCWLAVFEPKGIFTLVLEDMKDAIQGNQLEGCTPDVAKVALSALAQFQAPFLANPEIPKNSRWLWEEGALFNTSDMYKQTLPAFLERYADLITPEHAELCRWIEPHVAEWLKDPVDTIPGIRHRDYRLDNILFPSSPGGRVAVVDFQGVSWGSAMEDVSYFMGSSLTPDNRRACEKELLMAYVAELNGDGPVKLDWGSAWRQYRRGSMFGVLQAVYASILCVRTPRGDIMFTTLLRRHAEHCIDMNLKELFP